MSLTDNDVLKGVRGLIAQGKIRWTAHVEDMMVSRGYARSQIKECLMKGYFTEAPIIANKPGPIQYKFRIKAIIDGEGIEVVASLTPDEKVVVITVFDPT